MVKQRVCGPLKWAVKLVAQLVITLWAIITITFILLALTPGDALSDRTEKMPEHAREQLYRNYGLDKGPVERYWITMENIVLRADFGESIAFPGQKVSTIITQKAPVSIRLGLQSLVVSMVIGIALGVVAAIKKDSKFDKAIRGSVIFFAAFPSLLLAIFLQKTFAGQLGLLPVIGWPKDNELWFGGWQWTILPTLSIALSMIPGYARLARNSLLDHLHSPYILTARANGTRERNVIVKHVLKNAAIPIVTGFPVSVAGVCTGTFFVENVFALPGIGKYFIESVASRDVTTVLGLTAYFALLYIVAVACTDILYRIVDPRIRLQTSAVSHVLSPNGSKLRQMLSKYTASNSTPNELLKEEVQEVTDAQ